MLRSARQLSTDERAFHPCPRDKATVRAYIEAAERKMHDALIEANSFDTRVEANYDACFNLALAVLNAEGWRARAVQGHHEFILEAACSAMGASDALFSRVDATRQVRNRKYTGISRTQQDFEYSQKVLQEFATLAAAWMQAAHGDMLKG